MCVPDKLTFTLLTAKLSDIIPVDAVDQAGYVDDSKIIRDNVYFVFGYSSLGMLIGGHRSFESALSTLLVPTLNCS